MADLGSELLETDLVASSKLTASREDNFSVRIDHSVPINAGTSLFGML